MAGSAWSIVFDFDGTLVDSAPGILSGMAQALAARGLAPRVPLAPEIIGPPLTQTLALISGIDSTPALAELATEFKRFYDHEGYRDTLPYPGVEHALRELRQAGMALHIATNKRARPTRLILDHLGWTPLFASVYCLDECPACPDKAAMLGKLLQDTALRSDETLYIGDTLGDAIAAKANNLPFIHATWGYGRDGEEFPADCRCDSADHLPETARQLLVQGRPCPAN